MKTSDKNPKDEILESITTHRKLETKRLQRHDKILAVGHCKGSLDSKAMQFWLTNKENSGSSSNIRNITGAIVGTESGADIVVNDNGKVVYKNSMLGGHLIGIPGREVKYSPPKGIVTLKVDSLTTYTPDPHKTEATDIILNFRKRRKETVASLRYYLDELRKSQHEKEEEEVELNKLKEQQEKAVIEEQKEFEVEIARRQERIEELVQSERENRQKAKSFIRKNIEIRYQPILDPWQEDIKRSNIYTNTVAIDGGPGTGKTTCLIQRMKFLTDRSAMLGNADEPGYMPSMTIASQEVVFGQKNWIFFSPNELLKLFLRNSMIQEGLSAGDDTIYVWENYRNKALKDYKFINTETRRPFLMLNKRKAEQLLPVNEKELKAILTSFENFYIGKVASFLEKIIQEDHQEFVWFELVSKMLSDFRKRGKPKSYKEAIRLFFDLESQYSSPSNILRNRYDDILDRSTRALEIKIENSNR